jgi:hypothetical protein
MSDIIKLPDLGAPSEIRYRLGFTVDVVGYSSRTIDAQRQVQHRLLTLFYRFIAETGIEFVPEAFQSNGDGFHYFLPDSDVHMAVSYLLSAFPAILAEDNQDNSDRIRLRMATDIGTVGLGPLGFTADAVIRFSRLVDSKPIRDAVKEHDTDLVALVSDTLYQDVITRFDDLARLPFQHVDVEVKNYRTCAHLLVYRW